MNDPIQQQLIAARQNQILDAATVVFAERGFHATTTRDIARQAGISEGTIYNYFKSKTALLMGIFERMRLSVIQQNMPPAPGEIDLRTFIETFLQHPLVALRHDNTALFRIVISEMMVNDELRTMYYQQIMEPTLALADAYFKEEAARRGLSPTDASLTIRAISGMVLGLMMQYLMGDSTVTEQWDRLPDLLPNLILNGLRDNQD
jgi:AcrR family transcriptional regulator